jgi:hypothetical protein
MSVLLSPIIPALAPVSQLETKRGFEIVTQLADTKKMDIITSVVNRFLSQQIYLGYLFQKISMLTSF